MERLMKNVCCINRGLNPGQYFLTDVFTDIRSCKILRTVFEGTEDIDQVLAQTRVFLVDHDYEMFVDDKDASITIGLSHLRTASEDILYLDIIHELCHVQQWRQGRDLYDQSRAYVDRDTEIEAYLVTVSEARRIGLDDQAIADYLRVSWVTPQEHQRLARRLNVNIKKAPNA
jgi:hypothetical protein